MDILLIDTLSIFLYMPLSGSGCRAICIVNDKSVECVVHFPDYKKDHERDQEIQFKDL